MGIESLRGREPMSRMVRVKAGQDAQQSGQAQFGQRPQSPTALAGTEKPNAFKVYQGQDPFNAGRAAGDPLSFAGATGVSGQSLRASPLSRTADSSFVVPTVNLVSSGVALGGGYTNAGFGQGLGLAGTRLNRLG